MLLTDRMATVRLYFELFYLELDTLTFAFALRQSKAKAFAFALRQSKAKVESLSSCLSESLLAYLGKSTLSGDQSLPAKVGTGWEQSLASDRGKVTRQGKQVNCEVEISTGIVDRWLTFEPLKSGTLPCKLRTVSFYYGPITTKLTTLSIRKKRLEDSLAMSELPIRAQPRNAIPVNHNEMDRQYSTTFHGNEIAQTTNTSYYLWGGGPVVLSKGRGLNIGYANIRSYSTKISSEAPSWNDTKVAKRMKSLWDGNRKDPNFINEGLWKLLNEADLWTFAYLKLSPSKGSNTGSFDRATIDGTTTEKLISLKEELTGGNYEFGTKKRLYIPKANGNMRPLGLPPFKDRIIQEVVRTILEVIYEPIFSNHSHGFRPGRSCHTALRHVVQKSTGFTWAIEGNIAGFYDNIDHKILLTLINKKIKDPRFVSLIYKMLKTKVQEEGSKSKSQATISLIGSPQGSKLKPLLSNIMLHELDKYMEEYIVWYNRGQNRRINPEYERLLTKFGAQAARSVPYFKNFDPSYRRMHYVRYADDFIITIIGPKNEATEIKNHCEDYLSQLNLTLSVENNTNPRMEAIPFLGYLIQKSPKQKYSYSRMYGDRLNRVSVIRGGQVYLKADLKKVRKRLFEKGFCMKNGFPIPNFAYLSETQDGSLKKVYYILRGLASYYKLARNYRDFMSRINYILRYSTAKMFAAKFRLSSIAKVFAKAGKDLSRPINKPKPELFKKDFKPTFDETIKASSNGRHINPLNSLNWRVTRTANSKVPHV